VFLAGVLPRHSLGAPDLGRLLAGWLAGQSLRAAAGSLHLPWALESLYHVRTRLRRRLAELRGWLCRRGPPPTSGQTDPLLQTVEHLQQVFAGALCPVSEFQLVFQQPFLG
jgi:hypothetical protein